MGDLHNVSTTRQVVINDAVFIATTESNVMHSVAVLKSAAASFDMSS